MLLFGCFYLGDSNLLLEDIAALRSATMSLVAILFVWTRFGIRHWYGV